MVLENISKQLIICALLVCAMTFAPAPVEAKTFTVVLDAGHGGKDPGAVGKKINEKTINLDIILKLGELIKKNHPDVKVVYTRSKDVFVELGERARIANRSNADLFISVHTNAAQSRSANGTETYVLGLAKSEENLQVAKRENSVILLEDDYSTKYEGFDPTSTESYIMFDFMQGMHLEQSINMASLVQSQFKDNAKRSDRGVRQAGFWVLRATGMPSVLVEVGYISNSEEEKYLAQSVSRTKLAESIYNAFKGYKWNWSRKQQGVVVEKPQSDSIVSDNIVGDNVVAGDSLMGNTESQAEQLPAAETEEVNNEKEDYRIQILTSSKNLNTASSQFKGLSGIRKYQESNLYKYTYGSFATREEAAKELVGIKKLFKDAFVVHFIGDKKQKK